MRETLTPSRPRLLLAVLSAALLSGAALAAAPSEAALREAAARQGDVTDLRITTAPDGSLAVTGRIASLPFVARFPNDWNRKAVVFAHGYVTPGREETIPTDRDPSGGVLTVAQGQGFATAYSAYAKTGYAVQSGIEATLRLKRFLDGVGARQTYATGASMGGNIVAGLVEKYPRDFVGALAYCGVMGGWAEEMRMLIDFRLVFDALTRGTPYALPGAGDVLTPNAALTQEAVVRSVGALFQGAARDPRGAEARVIGVTASAVGVSADPVTFVTMLAGAAYGLADQLATSGGNGYSNTGKVYSSPLLDEAATRALNAAVQRLTATPEAEAYLRSWYTPTGRFTAKVLSIHNTSDPLVPFQHQALYRATVARAGNSFRLAQQTVAPKPVDLANIATSGPTHCYFSPAELGLAWNSLRAWVETGERPENGRDITSK